MSSKVEWNIPSFKAESHQTSSQNIRTHAHKKKNGFGLARVYTCGRTEQLYLTL